MAHRRPLFPTTFTLSNHDQSLDLLPSLRVHIYHAQSTLIMFYQATQRAFRGARAPLSVWAHPFAQLHAFAPGTQLSRIAQTHSAQLSSRWTSSLPSRQSALRRRILPSARPALASPISQSTRRPFFSGPRSQYQYNQYNRFNGPRRGSLFYTLIQNARPHHFVIIGLGISGVYLYNTDVVAVRKTPNPNSLVWSQRHRLTS